MKFSIVTPSFRSGEWLPLCIASVADQEGVVVEHLVQDGGSDDGTLDWLLADKRVAAQVEPDAGMYDAVNRGWRRATGEVLSYLNCDEQYLPHALQSVQEFFIRHPDLDVALADSLVVDGEGRYICHRMSLIPWWTHMWHRFPAMSCGIFFRRRLLDEDHLYFDPRWRVLGDFFWVMSLLERGVRMGVLRQFTAAFADTGANLGLSAAGRRESQLKLSLAPRWIRLARPAIINHHWLRCWVNGFYSQRPFRYAIYTRGHPSSRVSFTVARPTGLWRSRWQAPAIPVQPAAGH